MRPASAALSNARSSGNHLEPEVSPARNISIVGHSISRGPEDFVFLGGETILTLGAGKTFLAGSRSFQARLGESAGCPGCESEVSATVVSGPRSGPRLSTGKRACGAVGWEAGTGSGITSNWSAGGAGFGITRYDGSQSPVSPPSVSNSSGGAISRRPVTPAPLHAPPLQL